VEAAKLAKVDYAARPNSVDLDANLGKALRACQGGRPRRSNRFQARGLWNCSNGERRRAD